MQARAAHRHQLEGWRFSFFLHGLLLSMIWPILHHIPTPIRQEPFRWNVTLVESLPQSTVVEPIGDASLVNETLDGVESAELNPAPLKQNVSPPAQAPTQEIDETIQSAGETTSATATAAPAILTPAQPEPASPPPSITEAPPATDVAMALTQPRDASDQPPASLSSSTSSPPSATPPSVIPPAVDQSSATRADYSWLQRALSRRLEELKRSARPSLDDASKLKVLVKAVVSSEGELMEAEVVKSSGLARIDQEAMTLVRRAFPMPLDYALDRPQIVMRIPITYSRD